jgi:hypothetical protein
VQGVDGRLRSPQLLVLAGPDAGPVVAHAASPP